HSALDDGSGLGRGGRKRSLTVASEAPSVTQNSSSFTGFRANWSGTRGPFAQVSSSFDAASARKAQLHDLSPHRFMPLQQQRRGKGHAPPSHTVAEDVSGEQRLPPAHKRCIRPFLVPSVDAANAQQCSPNAKVLTPEPRVAKFF